MCFFAIMCTRGFVNFSCFRFYNRTTTTWKTNMTLFCVYQISCDTENCNYISICHLCVFLDDMWRANLWHGCSVTVMANSSVTYICLANMDSNFMMIENIASMCFSLHLHTYVFLPSHKISSLCVSQCFYTKSTFFMTANLLFMYRRIVSQKPKFLHDSKFAFHVSSNFFTKKKKFTW